MKRAFLFCVLLTIASLVFSQSQTPRTAMGNPVYQPANQFDMYQKTGGGGVSAFKTNIGDGAEGSQFFLTDWSDGELVLKNEEIFNTGLLFVYDKVRQELFIRHKDSALVLLGNKDEIKAFTLKDKNGRAFYFINSSHFGIKDPQVFYQVLVYDTAKLSLLKYIKTRFETANTADLMRQREGKMNDAFVDRYIYYISKNESELKPVNLKSKSIKKVFEELGIHTESYLNAHDSTIDEGYLIDMVKYLNHQ